MNESPLLELKGITREYSGYKALDNVDFTLHSGEVHVLFGENGAGKSTLISIIAGAVKANSGQIRFKGQTLKLSSVHHARKLGISAVFQEFSLIPELTVEENIFLGVEETRYGCLNRTAMHDRATRVLARLGFQLRPDASTAFLSRAEQQMVEIAKAFRDDLSILILDEPTASLTERETKDLFSLVNHVKSQHVGIIYITHRMNEIRQIGDRITILRDGKFIDTVKANTPDNELVRMMTGKAIDQIFPAIRFKPEKEVLKIRNLSTTDKSVIDASINVRRGEIVGIAGLVGSGKSEIARSCFGLIPKIAAEITFNGEEISQLSPKEILDRGMFYIPADRREEGLMMMRSARENIALPALTTPSFSSGIVLKRMAEQIQVKKLSAIFNLQPSNTELDAGLFSGGNQQKIMLAKCQSRQVDLFIFDEPTVGVDVGTRTAIYKFIRDLCEQSGAAVLLISSDLPEILHLTHRVYVMCGGSITAELESDEIVEKNILKHFFRDGSFMLTNYEHTLN
ncbi:MAG: sugar ABC transporter ATP-binding protein [Gammaproteobacteria bacterium]|nr:sugar ABC transporter ATP-binding protein [Gammaproteobacteria bacterium]